MAQTNADKVRVQQEKRVSDNQRVHDIHNRAGATKKAHVVINTPRFQPLGGTTVSLGTNGVLQPTLSDNQTAVMADNTSNVPQDTPKEEFPTEQVNTDWISKIFDFITENKLLVSGFLLLIVFRKQIMK